MRCNEREARAAEVRESIRPRWLYGLRGLLYVILTIRDAAARFLGKRIHIEQHEYAADGHRWFAVVIAVRGRGKRRERRIE